MSGYNSFPGPQSGIKMGVIAGGDKTDPEKDHTGNQKIYNPILDDPQSFSLSEIGFSSLGLTPSQFGQQSFPGVMDPGTMIYYIANEGMNGGIVLGQGNTLNKNGGGGGSNQIINELRQRKIGVNTPPDVQEGEERGAKVRKIKESGEEHRLELLDGLPIHGALFKMAGWPQPEVKKVPTAKKQGSKMMSQDMMNQLMGQVQSIGGMLQGLKGGGGGGSRSNLPTLAQSGGGGGTVGTKKIDGTITFANSIATGSGAGAAGWGNTGQDRLAEIVAKLPENLQLALKNLAILVPGHDTLSGTPYITGGIVHPETYLNNAEQLLSQVTTLGDLMTVLHRLTYDTTLFGQDKLSNVVISVDTAWGKANQVVDIYGNVTIQYSKEAQNAIANFEKMMANTTLASGFTSGPATSAYVDKGVYNADTFYVYNDMVSYQGHSYAATTDTVNHVPTNTNYWKDLGAIKTGGTTGGGTGGTGGGGTGGAGGGGGSGQNIMGQMFGKSQKVMQDMMKRLHMGGEQESKQMTQKLAQDQKSQKNMQIAKKTINDGDPLSKSLFG